jgi:hypothetical protein
MNVDYSLYLVTDRNFPQSSDRLEDHIRESIQGSFHPKFSSLQVVLRLFNLERKMLQLRNFFLLRYP